MNKLLLESIDNESRKGAINFLKANFNRCFPLEDQNLTQAEKDVKVKQYEENVELTYAEPWNIERSCNWTKALIQGCVRILKTECNDESARPANERMISQMHKLYFAAMMYRQKQVWDGVRKEDIMSKDMNGWSFYKLSSVVMPHYEELERIYNEGYGDAWPGKDAFREGAIQRRREKEAADAARKQELEAKIARGEELTAEEQNFMAVMQARAEREAARAVDQAEEIDDEGEQLENNPWSETNWNGHKPYMGNMFKVGNNGYYAVKITQKRQASTWWYWGWPECPHAGQIGARWCICGNGGHFGGYGIGTRCTAYFIFKEGFQNLVRPMTSRTAPNDEWGTSLMCLMVDEDTKPENEYVRNFTSRYNHYGPGINNHAGGDWYGDGFFDRKVDNICTLLGITKDKFFQLFPFKNDDGIDVTSVMKKIIKGDFDGNRKFNFGKIDNNFGKFYIVHDRDQGLRSVFKDGRFIIPWCYDFDYTVNNDFMYFYGEKNRKRQYFDSNGLPLLPEAISTDYRFHVFKNNILCVSQGNNVTFYNLKTRRWITSDPVNATIYWEKSNFPYLYIKNHETGEYEMQWYDIKTHKLIPVHTDFEIDGVIYAMNNNFIVDNHVNAYCRRTGEKINMSNDIRDYYVQRYISDYFFGTDNHYITADGKEVRLPSDETVDEKIIKGKNRITATYEYSRVNGERSYKYRFYNADGEKIFETDATNEHLRYDNNSLVLIYNKVGDNTLYYTSVSIDGEITNKSVENARAYEFSKNGDEFFFISLDGKIYGKNLEVLYDLGMHLRSVRSVDYADPKYGWYKIGVTDDDFNRRNWIFNTKIKKVIPLKNEDSTYIPMGFGYIFLPGEKLTDPSRLIDDEGREVFNDVYKFVTGFGTDGVASFKGRRNRMLYVNTDNEMSDTMDELVESMERKRMNQILNEGTEVQQKTDWWDIAAYFC